MSVAYGAAKDGDAEYPDRISYILDSSGTVEQAEKVSDIEAHVDWAIKVLSDS